ncbi:MAG TPA: tetratricopeptide repeat protein [Candidatus Sabulitectum sp.]|nr:tetratricopeptide repeat protein [Candidatus Sabulitectum sp.]HPF33447.1 tetratricopeptide repeat protein [Candidatus Sabulitectum sp.]HPJ27534.1 tetratricopeptide repeat protein [Candidatus Sabulitectum sp.]HPR21536.1 tetratricopeptide repeat protein [Candidatus Sabulitectum sp.]
MNPASNFFGREEEIRELRRLLRSPGVSVVTITGIGGMGKTTLAARIMDLLSCEFPGGGVFVPLEELEHSGQLVPAVLSSMGLSRGTGIGEKQLFNALHRRRILLVLDNFEHIISAASVIDRLAAAGESRILVTSRTRLGIPGEREIRLRGFSSPSRPDELDRSPGVRLFLSAAGTRYDDYETISAICGELQGIPLGIKLAASMTQEKEPVEILELLRSGGALLDVDGDHDQRRHRNLRTVFSYSWQHLDPDERRAFAGVSVFRGAFSAGAAGEVAGASPGTLNGLCRKSILDREDSGVLSLHPLLREFGKRMLSESYGLQEQVADAHAMWIAGFLNEMDEGTDHRERGGSPSPPDVVAGVHRLMEKGDVTSLRSLLNPMKRYLVRWGLLEAGAELFQRAAGLYRGREPEIHHLCLVNQGAVLSRSGCYDRAVPVLEEALQADKASIRALVHYELGVVYMRTANLGRARDHMTRALDLARSSGEPRLEIMALGGLGDIYNHLHDPSGAEYFIRQSIEACLKAGDRGNLLSGYITLSNVMFNVGRGEEALEYAGKSLVLAGVSGEDLYAGLAELSAAGARLILGHYHEALAHVNRSIEIFDGLDSSWGLQTAYTILGRVQQAMGTGESLHTMEMVEELSRELGGTYNTMESLIAVAAIYQENDLSDKAINAYRRAEKIALNLNLEVYRKKITEAIQQCST